MSQTSTKGERTTAVISTLVALVILAVGVTAQQNHAQPQDKLVQLESDLRFQLEKAYRHDTAERYKRLTHLESVIDAWSDSPQSEKDRVLFADWLLEATIRSMPGTGKNLPRVPEFGAVSNQAPVPVPLAVAPIVEPKVESQPVPIEPDGVVELNTVEDPEIDFEFQASKLPDAAIHEIDEPTLEVDASSLPSFEEDEVANTIATELDNTVSSRTPVNQPLVAVSNPQPIVEHPQEIARINVFELSARITAYHRALDKVETQILVLEETDFEVIAVTLRQLQEILRDYQFAKLYYDALDTSERRGLKAPRSPRPTLLEIDRRIENQQSVESGDFLGSFETSRSEKAKELRQLVATLANALGN